MNRKIFFILTFAIILLGFITRIYAIHNNNIFFTADEGRDAVFVRQIINYHQIFTRGPESSVRGIFTGPLWYYFIAIGYAALNGNPAGSVLVLIVLNLAISLLLIWVFKKNIDWKIALITGFGLIIFWPFFRTSLYGFNPFPLVSLSIILILLLLKKRYCLGLIPVILALNTELAGAIVFLLFYIVMGLVFVIKGHLSFKKYTLFAFGIPLIGLIKIANDFLHQSKATTNAGLHVFAGTNFIQMAKEFVKIIGQTLIPQNYLIGFLLMIAIAIMYIKLRRKNKFIKQFVYLSFLLIFISYLFFGSNHGWREWHTVYIQPFILITSLLICYELKTKGKTLIILIFFLNIINFRNNYINYLKPSNDRSLLYNQIKVVDWIYTHSENNGFNLYTYTDSYYDYSYQYLISWYAKNKYGFYPCEYSNFPLSIKMLYVPNPQNYVEPKLGCDKFRFLIIDSNTNGNTNKDWINGFRGKTVFLEKTQIGNTTIEKRATPDIIK
jgi:hypothetical protein